jgi:hypothetical protein
MRFLNKPLNGRYIHRLRQRFAPPKRESMPFFMRDSRLAYLLLEENGTFHVGRISGLGQLLAVVWSKYLHPPIQWEGKCQDWRYSLI